MSKPNVTTKTCGACFVEIDTRAKVCNHCQARQGFLGWVIKISLVVSLIVTVLGAAFSARNAWLTESDVNATNEDRKLIELALAETEVNKYELQALSFEVWALRSMDSCEKNYDKDCSSLVDRVRKGFQDGFNKELDESDLTPKVVPLHG